MSDIPDIYKTPLVLGIHGFNSQDSLYMRVYGSYVERAGYRFKMVRYYQTRFDRRRRSEQAAAQLAEDLDFWALDQETIGLEANTNVICITHSNGAVVAVKAAERCKRIKGLSLNNAALRRNWVFPDSVEFIHNRFVPTDKAVKASVFMAAYNNFMRREDPWGDLGANPYIGPSESRVTNYDLSSMRVPHPDIPGQTEARANVRKTHSDWVEDSPEGRALREVYIPEELQEITKAVEAFHL